ncbi:MAG: protein TolQ [Deltaproteobacteria bacterium]|nr:protein TolQ [Deltaproteobacteria bacterium]MBW1847278.1 protein TolQ [Deltaproteobacteria bacterium]MBW2179911.1 protein TolQ [Deltaproteobacteria bacterium]
MISQGINLIHMVSNAGLMVQFVLFLLLFFSVSSWAIIIMKYQYVRRAFNESAAFNDFFWKRRNLSDAFKKAKELDHSPIARVFRIGYVELKKLNPSVDAKTGQSSDLSIHMNSAGTANVSRALRRAINTEMSRMTQMVPFLATTGNTAPFIGLFGTVWGIMNSFHSIGLRGSANLAVVAPGISEALVATAAGLLAAIPAVIAFNYFMQKIRVIESELQSFSADFLNIIERDILRANGGGK